MYTNVIHCKLLFMLFFMYFLYSFGYHSGYGYFIYRVTLYLLEAASNLIKADLLVVLRGVLEGGEGV